MRQLFVCILVLLSCVARWSPTVSFAQSDLPPFIRDRPFTWVCPSSLRGATEEEKQQWCDDNPYRGEPVPEALRSPPPATDLLAKNRYDILLNAFIRLERYRRLDWKSDPQFRFSGPYVGDQIPDGTGFGTHLPMRIFYSPGVVDWLCEGREGEIPEGEMIVKTMTSWGALERAGQVGLDSEGCLEVPTDARVVPLGWAIMVKKSGTSFDSWYWPVVQRQTLNNSPGQQETPPLFNRSGLTTFRFFDGIPPDMPEEDWYPSGFWPANQSKWPNVVTPFQQFGALCTSCHAVADSESTFSDLSNILGKPIRYKQLAGPKAPLQRFLHTWPGWVSEVDQIPVPGADLPQAKNPFTKPLPEPDDDFLDFYDQLDEVSFREAWWGRFPAQTWDHVMAAPGGIDAFVTSDQCVLCHDAVNLFGDLSNMRVSIPPDAPPDDQISFNLSPSGEWSSSPMGLSGRDPIFFAQLQSETNRLPRESECIESLCTHCHAPMGQRQFATDNPLTKDPCGDLFGVNPPKEVPVGEPFAREILAQWPGAFRSPDVEYAALGRDGVSCTICHRIAPEDLGREASYTGNFVTGPPNEINGPYRVVSTAPMKGALGANPQFGRQIRDADLCASCHNILLPVFSNRGDLVDYSYEQTTGLEWRNSDYATGRRLAETCQGCHMPTKFLGEPIDDFIIANFESSLFPPTTNRLPDREITPLVRRRYSRHTLHGLNAFLNEMFQQFPILLGFRQGTFFPAGPDQVPSLLLTSRETISLAQRETATVEITKLTRTPRGIRARIRVSNLAGHYLPSGVGFRRLFLEVVARDATGNPVWSSGQTNSLGAILDGATGEVLPSEEPVKFPNAPIQPHYQIITAQDQVQIYQELVRDSRGDLTTSFLRRFEKVKDNRIRPVGYNPAFYRLSSSRFIRALAESVGAAKFDPYYRDPKLTGADVIEYRMTIPPNELARVTHVTARLYNQSIPPSYLQQRFRDANEGARQKQDIRRLYYMTSHLNVRDTLNDAGDSVLRDWKLAIASDFSDLPPSPSGR